MAVAALIGVSGGAAGATVDVTGGAIRGQSLSDGSAVYRAIPYAAPPLGALRWKPPQPVIPWKGVRDAVKAPRPCVQANEDWNAAEASRDSEDCLYLSIHAPKHEAGAKLPVFFWVHGGSNRAGSGYGTADSPIYQGGIVVVGIEYRLGVFGFLATPQLASESAHHSSGNYGLLDQIAALKWVRNNVAVFGGDPDNVTIGGQSAGAMDIAQLMRSPLARGLFARVIQESGSMPPTQTLAASEAIGDKLLTKLGLAAKGLAELRAVPAQKLLAAVAALPPEENGLWMPAVVDGWVLPDDRGDLYRNGEQAPVPLIIGNVAQEIPLGGTPAAARGLIQQIFARNSQQALKLYGFHGATPPTDDPVLGSVGTQVNSDMIFRCPINVEAQWQLEAGENVWRYEFGVKRPGSDALGHNAELDYVFLAVPKRATFGSWPPVQQYWTNFIKTGDPNGPGLPQWPALGTDRGPYMEFAPTGPAVGHDLRGPICRLMAETHRADDRTQ